MQRLQRQGIQSSTEHSRSPLTQKEKANIRAKKWFKNNKEYRYAYIKEWNKKNKGKNSGYQKKHKQKLKNKVFSHYCEGKILCDCCGEKHIEFLTLDHINGGGNKHRKEVGCRGGHQFYQWIVNNNYPEGYRILCFNCNHAIYLYDKCPHKS